MCKLATKAISYVLDKFDRKISEKCAVRPRKEFTLFISNEDINDVIKIIESIEKLGPIIDGATETVQHEIKNKKVDFL